MIYERIDKIKFDVNRLVDELNSHVLNFEPVMNIPAFGGWSILSASGSYRDGWQPGHLCFKQRDDGSKYYDHALASSLGVRPSVDHTHPTEIITSYVAEIIDLIKDMGLEPCRARWTVLKAKSSGSIHRDAPDEVYAVRLHIPVVTNENCLFISEGEAQNAPADGYAYLVKVNRLHQIVNSSDQDRFHLLMNVTDREGVSRYHRYPN